MRASHCEAPAVSGISVVVLSRLSRSKRRKRPRWATESRAGTRAAPPLRWLGRRMLSRRWSPLPSLPADSRRRASSTWFSGSGCGATSAGKTHSVKWPAHRAFSTAVGPHLARDCGHREWACVVGAPCTWRRVTDVDGVAEHLRGAHPDVSVIVDGREGKASPMPELLLSSALRDRQHRVVLFRTPTGSVEKQSGGDCRGPCALLMVCREGALSFDLLVSGGRALFCITLKGPLAPKKTRSRLASPHPPLHRPDAVRCFVSLAEPRGGGRVYGHHLRDDGSRG